MCLPALENGRPLVRRLKSQQTAEGFGNHWYWPEHQQKWCIFYHYRCNAVEVRIDVGSTWGQKDSSCLQLIKLHIGKTVLGLSWVLNIPITRTEAALDHISIQRRQRFVAMPPTRPTPRKKEIQFCLWWINFKGHSSSLQDTITHKMHFLILTWIRCKSDCSSADLNL